MQDAFSRGHIDVYVNYENTRGADIKIAVNQNLADEYVGIAKKLAVEYQIENDFTCSQLMRTPDVLIQQVVECGEEELILLTKEAVDGAIQGLKKMRAIEGVSIFEDINKKINSIEVLLCEVKERAPLVTVTFRQKIEDRIKELLSNVAVDEARLLNEVAFFSDKVSIDEEITRLSAHIINTRDILKLNEPIGKKLDFIVQEFNREANTIGSKCNDLEITARVLSLKNEIEKIREQVQNIE
jgi:uncharacterized protein (TIGR00255 family)